MVFYMFLEQDANERCFQKNMVLVLLAIADPSIEFRQTFLKRYGLGALLHDYFKSFFVIDLVIFEGYKQSII